MPSYLLLMFVAAAPVSLALRAEMSVSLAPEVKGWATSAFGSAADTRPLDSLDLGAHLDRCRRSRGTLFPALCLADAVESFLAPRVFTTLAAVALVIGAGFGVL